MVRIGSSSLRHAGGAYDRRLAGQLRHRLELRAKRSGDGERANEWRHDLSR